MLNVDINDEEKCKKGYLCTRQAEYINWSVRSEAKPRISRPIMYDSESLIEIHL